LARDFDGVNDNITFGLNASIGNFTTKSVALYVVLDSVAADVVMAVKDRFTSVWGWQHSAGAGFALRVNFSGGQGVWNAAASFGIPTTGRLYHMVLTYDGSAVTNDPTLWVDGVSYAMVNTLLPVGTISPDAADPLLIGTNDINGNDLDGRIGWFCYANEVWDAAAVNRARWWGRPHGGIAVYHPLVTTKLANEGTATATGVATGTTVVGSMVPPVVRPGSAMMGMGVGW
jgi:hypothetical protein